LINDGPDKNGWRQNNTALEDAWGECCDVVEDRAGAINDMTTEVENVRSGEAELDRAASKVLEASRTAEEASQEVIELRSQLVEEEEAVRASDAAVQMVMASARSHYGGGNAANLNNFTIEPKRLSVFNGVRDIQVVGDFINELQRQFEVRFHEIRWLNTLTPAGNVATTATMAATEAITPQMEGCTRYALLQLKEAAGRWATSTFPSSQPYPTWDDFCTRLREEFTPLDAFCNFEDDWRRVTIPTNGHVATFNEEFKRLRLPLNHHLPMTAQQLLDEYAANYD
jgi:hypothetical protein